MTPNADARPGVDVVQQVVTVDEPAIGSASTVTKIVNAPARAEIRTAEAWATAKGMLPEFIEHQMPFAAAGSAPIRAHNPEHWKYNAAKAGNAWPLGKELTEAEFDAAVTFATTGHQYR